MPENINRSELNGLEKKKQHFSSMFQVVTFTFCDVNNMHLAA